MRPRRARQPDSGPAPAQVIVVSAQGSRRHQSGMNIRNPARKLEHFSRRGKAEAACVAGMYWNLHVVRFQLWR